MPGSSASCLLLVLISCATCAQKTLVFLCLLRVVCLHCWQHSFQLWGPLDLAAAASFFSFLCLGACCRVVVSTSFLFPPEVSGQPPTHHLGGFFYSHLSHILSFQTFIFRYSGQPIVPSPFPTSWVKTFTVGAQGAISLNPTHWDSSFPEKHGALKSKLARSMQGLEFCPVYKLTS